MEHPSEGARTELGTRLFAQERTLRLVLTHLAGQAIRARIDLEDLVQEVYLRALSAEGLPPAEDSEASLRRFLARIARNVVVDAARAIRAAKRDGRERSLERSDWSHAGGSRLAVRAPGPATDAAAAEGVARIVQAFEALSPEHRRVLGLRQLEGLSARETARRTGRSEVAVHSLYRRALEAWGQRLDGAGWSAEGRAGPVG